MNASMQPPTDQPLESRAAGGLREFGMNMLAITWAETTIVVDAGVLFPEPEMPGVDLIIPELGYLEEPGRSRGGAAVSRMATRITSARCRTSPRSWTDRSSARR